jgi:hypothetical protein
MYPRAHLLGIPAELRLAIYRAYLFEDGGYVYDYASDKLTAPDHHSIDLGLSSTCKLIAKEMRGMALNINSITFSTVYSADSRLCAGQFGALLELVRRAKVELVLQVRGCLNASMRRDIARKYPEFLRIMDRLNEIANVDLAGRGTLWREAVTDGWTFGEVPSQFQSFATHLCQLVVREPRFLETLDWRCPSLNRSDPVPHNLSSIPSISHAYWKIPTVDEITEMTAILDATYRIREDAYRIGESLGVFPCNCFSSQDHWSQWRFSAAAACIRFLGSLPETTRGDIRQITLLEDHESVARPECHAQGLIPFCLENPLLRVERRVSLWRNTLLTTVSGRCMIPFRRPVSRTGPFGQSPTPSKLEARNITSAIAPWIVEARALESEGMPLGSFQLILDGDPVKDRTTEVFATVLRDAAYQSALSQAHQLGLIGDPIYLLIRRPSLRYFRSFSKAVEELVRGKCIVVRCNFEVGDLMDADKILQEGRNWTAREWDRNWGTHIPSSFDTAFPLPPWNELLREEHPCDSPADMVPFDDPR